MTIEASGDRASRRGSEEHRPPAFEPSGFEDPLAELPETARRLLLAAKRIIAAYGFEALTLNAVAAESGENKAMISYYFGNKAGLVAAVLDSVIHDEYVASRSRMRALDPGQRREQLVRELWRMTDAADEFVVFFELLPHVLRDEVLRQRLAALYQWYWNAKLEWLGLGEPGGIVRDPDLVGLSQIFSAVIDGLALQVAIDPDVDLAVPFRVLDELLAGALALPGDPRGAAAVEQAGPQSGRPA